MMRIVYSKTRDCAFKMMNFAFKMMNCAFKMMNFAFKMMNFAVRSLTAGPVLSTGKYKFVITEGYFIYRTRQKDDSTVSGRSNSASTIDNTQPILITT